MVSGETGLSVLGTSAEEVADAVAKLLDNPELAEKFSAAGRRRAETHFSTHRVVETLQEEFTLTARDHKGRRPRSVTHAQAHE